MRTTLLPLLVLFIVLGTATCGILMDGMVKNISAKNVQIETLNSEIQTMNQFLKVNHQIEWQEAPLMIGSLTQSAHLYEVGEWAYMRLVEDIGTGKECVTGELTKDYTFVDSKIQVETPWGTMYWYDFNKENVGLMGWHVIPKEI